MKTLLTTTTLIATLASAAAADWRKDIGSVWNSEGYVGSIYENQIMKGATEAEALAFVDAHLAWQKKMNDQQDREAKHAATTSSSDDSTPMMDPVDTDPAPVVEDVADETAADPVDTQEPAADPVVEDVADTSNDSMSEESAETPTADPVDESDSNSEGADAGTDVNSDDNADTDASTATDPADESTMTDESIVDETPAPSGPNKGTAESVDDI